MSNKLPPIPSYPRGEKLPTVTKGAVEIAEVAADVAGGLVPGLGYIKQKMLDKFVRGPLELRRADFHDRIAEGLAILEHRFVDFDPSRLEENETFISAVYQTTQIAMKSSREQKRQYLVNAVLSIAKGSKLSSVSEGAFLQMIDRFSYHHMEVLQIYQNPKLLMTVLPSAPSGSQGPISIQGPIKSFIERLFEGKGLNQVDLAKIFNDLDNEKL